MTASTPASTARALDGVRILDLTRVLAGPYCAQNLADLGAEVIKVERPGSGDDTRAWGPPYVKDDDGHDTDVSTYYVAANRGKKSIALDLASDEGQRTVRALAMISDVVIENYKVGQLAKYGLDYASLAALKPALVYCSITGFGQTGPWARRPGYDFVVQGLSGFMSLTGEREGACPTCHGGPPQKAGIAIADLLTGIYASGAICAALLHARRTGQGQQIDMSLLDVMIATIANMNTLYLNSDRVPGRAGNAHQSIVPYQVFACADGHLILAVGNDIQWKRFCDAAGCPGLATDARFATNPARVTNRAILVPLLETILMGRAKHAWIAGTRSGRRAVRADRRHRGGVREPAGDRAEDPRRPAAPDDGTRRAGGEPDADERDAAALRPAASAARRASGGNPGSVARVYVRVTEDASNAGFVSALSTWSRHAPAMNR